MRFPKRIRHRGQVLATIYAKTKAFPAYRLAWRVTGKRRMERFQTYSEVKRRADALVKELAQGSHVTALTPKQATDALAALERLQGYFQQTGRRVSLLAAVTEYVEASVRLNGHTFPEAIDGYLANVASVKRKDIAEAVAEFLKTQAPLTKAPTASGRNSPASTLTTARFNSAGSPPRFQTPPSVICAKNTLTHSWVRFRNCPPRAATITGPPCGNSCNGPSAKTSWR
jgi:hypothetical protein